MDSARLLIGTIIGQYTPLPYPDQDWTGRTIIVTGANIGIGLAAARHLVRLNASKVIIGCRNADKGIAAKQDVERSTQRLGVVEVWSLDLCSFESVKEFAARAAKLDRLDALINNAGVLTMDAKRCDGHETMVTVNVLSTLLLTLLLLPTLRRTATKFNVTPHVAIVSSAGSFMASFPQSDAANIFEELKKYKLFADRYNTTKLIQLMMIRKLSVAADASGKAHVTVNALHPGLCRSKLFSDLWFPLNWIFVFVLLVFARTCEQGSRTLVHAVSAGTETHGKYLSECKVHVWPGRMEGPKGEAVTNQVWVELLQLMEEIEPGVTGNI
ncbi:hypothetical protein QQS21_004535 [Conoideocrella luteorostrata]|uniref:NAD(P)-binding protein n=1 Tax=Conoideocrella luteorostrata TaxID=1105319 RepID=A0AAJ0CU94_9HYPO|nr:hypothetical protein QQS21_004535 [Conoideocrella luteorostrata]